MAVGTPEEALVAIRSAVAAGTGTRWIGIDGFGASGKTTFAEQVRSAVPGSVVVHVDDFARPGLTGWDLERFREQLVLPLLAGRTARYQRWDFDRDTGADWVDVPAGLPVVVEGVSATDVRLGVPWHFTVWLDVPADVRWNRVLARDRPVRLDRWREDWIPSEQAYVEAQRPQERVDLIVRGAP